MFTHQKKHKHIRGFTLIELIVVITIIALLASLVLTAVFNGRKQSRDMGRITDLQQLNLALKLYKEAHGEYPLAGCDQPDLWTGPAPGGESWFFSCPDYIPGLVPTFLPELPKDPNNEDSPNEGYMYRSNGTDYKLRILGTVENFVVEPGDEYAMCAASCSESESELEQHCKDIEMYQRSFAIYTPGAACW